MHLNLKDLDSKPGNAMQVVSQIDSKSGLPFTLGEPCDSKPGKKALPTKSVCGCFMSVHDPQNANLTEPQELLKLDHDPLAHISMKTVQRLHQPRNVSVPDFLAMSCSQIQGTSHMFHTTVL